VPGRSPRKAKRAKRATATPKARASARASSPKATKRAAKPTATNKRPKARRTRESQATRKLRATRLLAKLRKVYANADCALHHGSALELLVATILSAQCTDERVNMVMPDLLRRYPDAQDLSKAEQEELEAAIRSTGFFRNKAKSLRGMAHMLCEEFDGEVPDTMEQLLRLPGVARKTANCVLGTWYGHNIGIVVDTHVGRLADRLGLLRTARDSKDAEKIERDLMALFPQEAWTYLAHALIHHGRAICTARKPACDECPLTDDCPSAGTFG